eukprot:TRINITY_DN12594_c0_g1_i1.p2 TRINITY_DN12594_c0_g1~~TRINITY_DN12594_c0_g1_i1.p2  ORF type:complete len:171 (-),score=11.25 TRINITY_DN12594_c0_g1_i1:120-632(-)
MVYSDFVQKWNQTRSLCTPEVLSKTELSKSECEGTTTADGTRILAEGGLDIAVRGLMHLTATIRKQDRRLNEPGDVESVLNRSDIIAMARASKVIASALDIELSSLNALEEMTLAHASLVMRSLLVVGIVFLIIAFRFYWKRLTRDLIREIEKTELFQRMAQNAPESPVV